MQTVRNDVTKVKEINVELIKSTLKELGTATKAQIAETTEISVATCGKILNALCESGEVLEAASTTGGYGRPAKSYVYNGNFSLVACVYVATDRGKVTFSAMVSNMTGEVQEEYGWDIETANYDVLEQAIERLVKQHRKLRVVAVGIPGYITNGVIGLCNFVELMGLPLRELLQAKFPDIKILVENDMNAAAYGFYRNQCADSDAPIAFIYSPSDPQTGIEKLLRANPDAQLNAEQRTLMNLSVNFGAGFVSGGRILRGFSGFAGEVSFLPVVCAQGEHSVNASVETMAHIIGSIVPILNPDIIALTGGYFDAKTVEDIRAHCLRLIAPQHMPQIILRDSVHDEYVSGLLNLALEELSCGVMLVKRRG